ncbi:Glycosyl transferase, family 1 [Plasmopara halstedii]|uniref:Glycosyl transferase, family 1 n=1 Tax=Plasmopara halstedii TaxID=4781 RepID=A0A0P1A4X9_PLAHL|nr:Glycosyl transferase, family 1 [Plasmopara halstedii]CEG35360.1 Glycosyl transferase, family 1 [Plasmopara halstedii]|eukprot:XP_024571729.1 Glycosyl transferase, family 1 [Plasmopara halstedii]
MHPRRVDMMQHKSLHGMLGVLLTLVFGILAFEIIFLSMDGNSVKGPDITQVITAVTKTSLNTSLKGSDAFYPDIIFHTDWSKYIKESDILHQAALHQACVQYSTSVIPWTYGLAKENENWNRMQLINESDPEWLHKLRKCPDIDIFLPQGLRNFGYCEDAAAYAKFLESRMLPYWALDPRRINNNSITYHDLCPHTPVIFFNHYSDGLLDLPDWPASKPVYVMPNIEMYELESENYWRADVVLCKTALCAKYLKKWYKQEGNRRGTKVFYSRHTTSNVALVAKRRLLLSENETRSEKNFSNVSFVHTVGSSASKGTTQVLDCWLSQSFLPRLDVYISQDYYNDGYKAKYEQRIKKSSNIFIHTGRLEPATFGQLLTEAAYYMCPSRHEGYGHYINQARSSRALIVTTDVAPMNELITSTSGVLFKAKKKPLQSQFLSGISNKKHALRGVEGYYADFTSSDVCKAMAKVLNTTIDQRIERADKALQQYYFDTVFFAHKMKELRMIARSHSSYSSHNQLRSGHIEANVKIPEVEKN